MTLTRFSRYHLTLFFTLDPLRYNLARYGCDRAS